MINVCCRTSKFGDKAENSRAWLLRPCRSDQQIRQILPFYYPVSSVPSAIRSDTQTITDWPCLLHRSKLLLTLLCRNSRAANWSPSKSRFLDEQRHSRDKPGPGAYNPSDVDSSMGGYIVSNFRNTGNIKFIKPKPLISGMRSRTPINHRMSKSLFLPSTRQAIDVPIVSLTLLTRPSEIADLNSN